MGNIIYMIALLAISVKDHGSPLPIAQIEENGYNRIKEIPNSFS
jgi:hypothetical protein